MRYDIKHANGHYEMYVNGKFYGSYDTFTEAAKDIEVMVAERTEAAA